MRVAVQRWLELPLLEAAVAAGRRSRHGREFDVLGDVAQNDGRVDNMSTRFQNIDMHASYPFARR